jgi:hypothetical protein
VNRWITISVLTLCMMGVGLATTSARADVTYSFTGVNDAWGGDNQNVAFTFTTSSFIDSFTSLLSSQLSSCTNCQISFNPAVYMAPDVPYFGDALDFNDSFHNPNVYMFSTGAFGAVGTYYSGGLWNTGKLVVSNSTTAVPEPGTVAMTLAAGLMLATVCIFRRKPATISNLA